MGPVNRSIRFVIFALLAVALVVPSTGQAADVMYEAPYAAGPQGGDANNHFVRDPETGEMAVLRVQLAGISGGLGCGGSGGFSYFSQTHQAPGATKVTVNFTDAIIDPYTFVHVSVRQGESFLASKGQQGLILHPVIGASSVTVELGEPSTAPIEVWFGIQVTSACPNIDGGRAIFSSVTVTS